MIRPIPARTRFPHPLLQRIFFLIAFCTTVLVMAAGCSSPGTAPGSAVRAGAGPSPAAFTAGSTGNGSARAFTFGLEARNMAFNITSVTVPAGADVTVGFHNGEIPGSSQVTGIAHNFAVYDSPAAATTIFAGDVITGGGDAVYRFTAPAVAGTYFFRDDTNTSINGSLIVR